MLKRRVYFHRMISGLGDWMTLLATALWISERFGSDKVPYVFLLSSLPHLLFARVFARMLCRIPALTLYALGQLLLAFNVFSLTIGEPSLTRLLVYGGFAATISAATRPAWDSLLGEWFSGADRAEVFIRVGAITSSLLILAPVTGGALSQILGYQAVFMIDAASFLLGLGVLAPQLRQCRHVIVSSRSVLPSESQKTEEWTMPANLRNSIFAWYALLSIGVLINGTEYLAFKNFGYTPAQVGIVIGCWGVGGLIAFATASQLQISRLARDLPIGLGVVLCVFLLVGRFEASCTAFIVAGFLNARCGGHLRAQIQMNIPDNLASLPVWSLINQRLSLINILGYVLAGTVLAKIPIVASSVLLVAGGFACAWLQRSLADQRFSPLK